VPQVQRGQILELYHSVLSVQRVDFLWNAVVTLFSLVLFLLKSFLSQTRDGVLSGVSV